MGVCGNPDVAKIIINYSTEQNLLRKSPIQVTDSSIKARNHHTHDMKHPARVSLFLSAFVLMPLLSGCTETEGQINAMTDRNAATRDSNEKVGSELQKMNQSLALLTRQINDGAGKRKEFEIKAGKSGGTERTLIKYREDLEKSLTEFAAAVSDYRKKYLAP